MKVLTVIFMLTIGCLEFVIASCALSYCFTAFANHTPTFNVCLIFILFLLWIGQKLINMGKVANNAK
jgi:hypothetical protein